MTRPAPQRGTLTHEAADRLRHRMGRNVCRRPQRIPRPPRPVSVLCVLDAHPEEVTFSVQDAQFMAFAQPLLAIDAFICGIHAEATSRGYVVEVWRNESAMCTDFVFRRA